MADDSEPSTSSAAESQDLFRHLQGEVTEEQFQAWNEMKTQTSSLILRSLLKSGTGSESDTMLSPAVLTSLTSVPFTQTDAASRASTISQLQAQSQLAGNNFSAVAPGTPEVLAKYLTGKMSFEEFYKTVEETQKGQTRGERSRKRKVDNNYIYEDDDDFETEENEADTDNQEDAWLPDSPRAADSGDSPTKKKARKTSSLILRSLLKSGTGSESDTMLSPAVLASLTSVPFTQTDAPASTNSLSVSAVWNYLDPSNPTGPEEEDEEVNELRDDSVLDLADAASRASTISQLQAQSQLAGNNFSAVALGTPEVLAKYLTGKMSFEEFYKTVEETQKGQTRGERSRKRKVDNNYIYEDDDDFETEENEADTDNQEDAWLPDSPRAADSGDSPTKKKARKPRRRQWQIPKSLRGLMGETHNQVARGKYEEAIAMCLELIRRAPNASEPYNTLGLIYDEQGDTTKATEFFLISAHMKRSDSDVWTSMANRLLKHNEVNKAIECLNQAVKFATTTKLELMEERSSLYEQMGETSKALMGYTQMLGYIDADPDNDDKYLALARKVCERYHSMKRTNDAARVLTTMFKSRPSLINSEDVNKLLDLRMTMKQYQACLEGLVDYCGVEATLDDGKEWNYKSPLPDDLDLKTRPGIISSVRVPSNLPQGFPLELLAKLCTCLIYLGFVPQAKNLVATLTKEDVEEDGNGERFLDVADAYMESDHCDEALPILQRCVQSTQYSQAAVWLRYGECLSSSGQLVPAVEAFSKVVQLAPNHLGARVTLSALQQQIGRHDEALQVLSGDGDENASVGSMEDQMLLLHKCHLLYSQKRNADFMAASRRLLFHYFREAHKAGYMKIVLGYKSLKHRLEAIRAYMSGHSDQILLHAEDSKSKKDKTSESPTKEHKVSCVELWDLYLKLCNVLLEEERWEDLIEVSLLGLTCPAFNTDPVLAKNAEFLCLTACLMTQNSKFAYSFIKDICFKEPDNKMAWNLFTQSLLFSNEIRHHKFCLRRLLQLPNNIPLGLLNGHNSLQNGSYRCALGEYVEVFRRTPTDPLVHLCIGLCYMHICCQRYTRRKEWLILQAIGFLNSYVSLRGHCQEAYYNIGRAMHQLDLSYAAVYYYKKALSLPPVIDDKEGTFDLKREIAYNLSTIYRKSGNMELARVVIRTYIIV